MKNMRVARKLMLAFGGVGVLQLALAGFSVWQLSTMSGLTVTAVENRMPKLIRADAINTATSDFRVAEGQHILAADPASQQVAEREMIQQRELVDANYKVLDATVQNPGARILLGKLRHDWEDYLGEDRKLVALSRAGNDAAATALMRGGSQRSFDVLSQVAADLATLEAKLATDSSTEAKVVYSRSRLLYALALLAVIAGMIATLALLVRQIARPLSAMTGALSDLAAGKMDVVVPIEDRTDEVGDLATAMKRLRDQLAAAERAKQEQTALIVDSIGAGLSRLAEGDLVARVESDLVGPFEKLKDDFNAAAESLQQTLGQVSQAASGINNGAGDIRQASDDLSLRTEQQAASLEETAAAMDQITATVRQTASDAGRANGAVAQAREQAHHSGEVVGSAVQAMGGIERASAEISEIITVIDGIAFQTNLLALNAGVEAARAGDAGKGFAVVASEVRALAQRTAEAAKDVKARITASGEQVKSGVQLVGEAGQALQQIIERIAEVDGLVSSIAASAEQQATGLQQVNTAVSEMDGVTQQNAAMVEQSTAAARSLAAEADGLARQIARFRTGEDVPVVAAAPVHRLPERAAAAGRKIAPAPRRAGNAAVAVADGDWSEF